MNIFILVEGKTERNIYPKWLNQLCPKLTKVDRPALVNQNNYCIISGNGYDSLITNLEQSIDEINHLGVFDFFVVVVDSDYKTMAETELEIRSSLIKRDIKISELTDFIVIVQRCCMETWLLGNRRIFTANPQSSKLKDWIKHFNVSIDDPETMSLPANNNGSIGTFHKLYFKEMRDEYYKNRDKDVISDSNHLTGITERFEETGHIATFGYLLDFCKKLNQ